MHALGARAIHFYYEDALDRIWLACAERLGLRVIRSPKAYASYDGKGTLTLAPSEALDPDDCLAQMIFHEACHALVQGPEAFFQEDWGLDNTTSRDVVRELACLRVQAQLAQPFGLRKFLAPTTEFRAFYDSLGPDPLEVTESESLFASSSELVESVRLAKVALGRADRPPFHPHLHEALRDTALIGEVVKKWVHTNPQLTPSSLWETIEETYPTHPSGFTMPHPQSKAASQQCKSCGFFEQETMMCHKAGVVLDPHLPACARWEGQLECGLCGACCREAFDAVEMGADDPFVDSHKHLVVWRGDGVLALERKQGRCPLLFGNGEMDSPYRCAAYHVRPKACIDFEVGKSNCYLARQRTGLSW